MYCYLGEKDKLVRIIFLGILFNISLENIAYIDDDINDLETLQAVDISAMPSKSPILHKLIPDFIALRKVEMGHSESLLIFTKFTLKVIFSNDQFLHKKW